MKKILFIVLLTFAMQANAQYYYPLPDTNIGWTVIDDEITVIDYYNYFTGGIKKDTVINFVSYSKLFEGSYTKYAGAYRSDTFGKTYFVPPDSLSEFILVDLSKNTGDTVKNVILTDGIFHVADLIVDSVDYAHTGHYTLKRLFLSNKTFGIISSDLFWIERVGTSDGIYNYFSADPEFYESLYCMSYNDTTYFSDTSTPYNDLVYSQGQCFAISGVKNISTLPEITISPNPASSEITVSGRQEAVGSIDVYNTLGDKVYTAPITDNRSPITINITSLPSGMYFAGNQKRKRDFSEKVY